jgi:hypothetical protein
MQQLHPDKNSNKDSKTKLAAAALFQLLTKAKDELPRTR